MEQKDQTRQEIEYPGTKSNQYSIEYLKITAPRLKFFSVLGFVASVLIFFSACEKDEEIINEEIIDEENPYGPVVLLKEGGEQPLWSPDGEKIAYLEDGKLYVMNTDGSNLQRLESPDISVDHAEMKGDESKIYFSGVKTGSDWDIYEVNSDGSNLKNLTNGVGNNKEPHISSDGKYILFLSYRDDNYGVWIMHADGSNPARITKRDYWSSPGSWSPDSRQLVFDVIITSHNNGGAIAGEISTIEQNYWEYPIDVDIFARIFQV